MPTGGISPPAVNNDAKTVGCRALLLHFRAKESIISKTEHADRKTGLQLYGTASRAWKSGEKEKPRYPSL